MSGVPLMRSGRPNPTGTGRYCIPSPGTCYCGECDHWRPMPAYDASHPTGRNNRQAPRRNRGRAR